MFGLGAGEVVVILVLALLVLGPQKLPEVAKQLARMMVELRRVADEVRRQFDETDGESPAAPPEPGAPSAAKALPGPNLAATSPPEPVATSALTPAHASPSLPSHAPSPAQKPATGQDITAWPAQQSATEVTAHSAPAPAAAPESAADAPIPRRRRP